MLSTCFSSLSRSFHFHCAAFEGSHESPSISNSSDLELLLDLSRGVTFFNSANLPVQFSPVQFLLLCSSVFCLSLSLCSTAHLRKHHSSSSFLPSLSPSVSSLTPLRSLSFLAFLLPSNFYLSSVSFQHSFIHLLPVFSFLLLSGVGGVAALCASVSGFHSLSLCQNWIGHYKT